ncbi:hypothetical protein [Ruminiclostridium cellulolyticum]|uniref:Uncharacterized protein n=1 Tax=Ruminiclostridium cellulolyticum (strain ATCC 35319 / DSM 5812 / JCM 6584 / H10) TaxID=394503 RepID=B8I959_RUMCH|nr:hypothetical protein [Ruminiclostridium cellulolyticum]ACL75319.1 hypothetical protein Ccel_0956 [Ruminiclostridium cellulolyticum H10]
MVMNLYILFLVSLPESFLNLIIALLITTRKEDLKVNKRNVIKFSTTILLMLLSTWIIRPISPNIITSVTLHTIAYSLIFMLVYKMKLIYALFGISFFLLIITTTEILYAPYVITYIFKGMANFQNIYHWYVLLAIPQRIFQVIVIVFLWRHEILLATRINRRVHRLFLASFLLLLFGEQLLYFVFLTVFEKMQLVCQITFSVSVFVIVSVLNILMFKLIYTVINGLIVKSYNKYCEFEDDVKFALDEIRSLLANNQVDEAVKLIDYITE